MSNIRIPTFFLNALDDPIVGNNLNYEAFKDNPNIALGTTKHGGHVGYYENFFSLKRCWYPELTFKFFNSFVS